VVAIHCDVETTSDDKQFALIFCDIHHVYYNWFELRRAVETGAVPEATNSAPPEFGRMTHFGLPALRGYANISVGRNLKIIL
jgi:hypothetical protein